MSMLATQRQDQIAVRRLNFDSVIVYGLFAVTIVLLLASAFTGWREAQRAAALAAAPTGAPAASAMLPALR